ncbi:MAG: hypothetical protein QGM48_10865 [Actinomycetota bacterium]|nr:hypothetical protein [Actinomycetota bacterium]
MLVAALGALAILARVPAPAVVGILAMSLISTHTAALLVLAAAGVSVALRLRRPKKTNKNEGGLLRHIAGRVSAGATVRTAIAESAYEAVPEQARRHALLGRPMADVGEELSEALPTNGAAFLGICAFSEHTGAAIVAALHVLADQADDAIELARQRRVALAQTKLSAVVVGVVPIVASVGLVALRGVPEPGGALIIIPMAIGIALQLVGTAVVFNVAARST